MGVTAGVSTPGSREEATKASFPSAATPAADEGVDVEALNDLAARILPEDEPESPLLSSQDATTYRGLAARANYLALDRADIQFAVKEVARRMARPRESDWQLMKRLARYLVTAPRAVAMFTWQHQQSTVDVYVDADWAGCKRSARSTSGGAIMVGWHPLKTWSSTQATVALSSGESELYALTKGASQALGFMALARDLGDVLSARVHTDANATLGIVNRQGLGKLRHVKVQYLWLQERVRAKELSVHKVPGPENPADLMTKYLPASDMERHLDFLNIDRRMTRAGAAPKLFMNALQDKWSQHDAGPGGGQVHEGGELTRVHDRPRRGLFTPMRVEGSPPRARPSRALGGPRAGSSTAASPSRLSTNGVDERRNPIESYRRPGPAARPSRCERARLRLLREQRSVAVTDFVMESFMHIGILKLQVEPTSPT